MLELEAVPVLLGLATACGRGRISTLATVVAAAAAEVAAEAASMHGATTTATFKFYYGVPSWANTEGIWL